MARQLIDKFENDEDGEQLAKFVMEVARQEHRMRFGEEAEAFIDNITKNDDLGKNRTHSGRRNSFDGLLGPM